MFYAKSTRGFYDTGIHGNNMPDDVVEITAEEHAALLDGQSDGKLIDFDEDGRPFLAEPAAPTAEALAAAVTKKREAAYRAESDPLFFKYQRGEVAEQVWLDKVTEIKGRYE